MTNYHVDYLAQGHNNDYIYIYNSTYDNLEVYPNPTSEKVYIEVENNETSIYLLDLNGLILFQQDNFHYRTLNLKGLAPGIYIIKCEFENKVLKKNLIIE